MLVSLNQVIVLSVIFLFKHFLADYPLQRPWMLKKFLRHGWVVPLAAHCLVHSAFTLGILAATGLLSLWYLAIVDFVIHFIMDRIKASPDLLGRFKPLTAHDYQECVMIIEGLPIGKISEKEAQKLLFGNTLFWWSLGIDQMVHHLTDLFIIWSMLHG